MPQDRTIAASALMFPFLWLLAACPAGTYGGLTAEQKASIVRGKTTRVELLREVGTPDQSIDLGGGKEELSYVREKYTTYGVHATSENTEFWITLDKGVVQDFGERPTTKSKKWF